MAPLLGPAAIGALLAGQTGAALSHAAALIPVILESTTPGDTVCGYLPVGSEPGSVRLLDALVDQLLATEKAIWQRTKARRGPELDEPLSQRRAVYVKPTPPPPSLRQPLCAGLVAPTPALPSHS